MGEVAASWVSIYPKIGKDFATTIRGEVQKSMPSAFGPVDKASEESGKKTGKKFGDHFKSAVTPLIALGAVAAVASFVDKSVKSFAELQDATAAAGVVFGDSMDIITAQSDKAAAAFGISKQQAIDASITFGTFGKSAGLAGTDLAGFATKMTALAGDMASFRGTSPEEAIEAIGSAMRGEAEPIRKYGVLLDDATLRNRALQLGLIKTTKDALTPQNKVLAAQAEILAQTTDAQGDFARTSESTANVAKRLAAESADLSAEIGEKLAPAIVAAQKAGISMIEWATQNQAVLVPLIGTLAVVTAGVLGLVAAGKAMKALETARTVIAALGDSFQALGSKAKLATLSLGAIGVALTIGATIYGLFASEAERAKQASADFADSLRADSGAIGENTQALIINNLEKEGALAAAQKLGIGSGELVNGLVKQGDAIKDLRAKLLAYVDGTGEQTTAMSTLLRVLDRTGGALGDAQASYQRVDAATTDVKKATVAATGAAKTQVKTLKDQIEALHQVATAQLALRGSQRGLEAAYDDATAAVKKNGRTLNDNTAKGRANANALDAIASAGLSVVEGLQKTGASGRRVGAAMDDARAKFIRVARQMGASKKEAQELANKLGLIKSKNVTIKTDIKSPNVESFMAALQRRVNRNPLYVPARAPKLIARAHGGPLPGQAPHDRADNMIYAGTPGEWVIQKPTVRYYGDNIMAALNAGRIPRERLQGFAYGGKVGGGASSSTAVLAPGSRLRITGFDRIRQELFADLESAIDRG